MSNIINKLVEAFTSRTPPTPQASMEEEVDLSSWYIPENDLPSMDYFPEPEKSAFHKLVDQCTEGISSWLKSPCRRKQERKVAEEEKRKAQEAEARKKRFEQADAEVKKFQKADDAKRKLLKEEGERRKLQKVAEDERRWFQKAEDERRWFQKVEDERKKERQQQTQSAIKMQKWFRRWRARQNIQIFMNEENPPLRVIAHMSSLMDTLDMTYILEIQLNELKKEIVSKRKATKQQTGELLNLEKDIALVARANKSLWRLVSKYKRLTEKNAHVLRRQVDQTRFAETAYRVIRMREELESRSFLNLAQCKCSLEEDSEMETLMTVTKKLLLDIIRVQPGKTLHEVLNKPASQAQDYQHRTLMRDSPSSSINVLEKQAQSQIMDDQHLSLEMKKEKVQANLEILQKAGLVKDRMGYNSILANIAKDMKMRHQLHQERKDEAEELRKTSLAFDDFSKDLQDRKDLYKPYIEYCANTFFCLKSRLDGESQETAHRHGKLQNGMKLQYTAEDLQRKGVIVGEYKNQENLKKEVLTIELDGGYIRVQLGAMSELLPVLDLVKMFASVYPPIKVFHYRVDISLFLFLLGCKIFRA